MPKITAFSRLSEGNAPPKKKLAQILLSTMICHLNVTEPVRRGHFNGHFPTNPTDTVGLSGVKSKHQPGTIRGIVRSTGSSIVNSFDSWLAQ